MKSGFICTGTYFDYDYESVLPIRGIRLKLTYELI